MLGDPDSGVRAAAIVAIGAINGEDAATLSRPLLADPDPRIRVTAAVALAASGIPEDVDAAEATLVNLSGDGSDSAARGRRDVAAAVRHIGDPRFRRLLIPLLYDAVPEVADEAMQSVQAVGTSDFVFVPTLVSLLRSRSLKGPAREVLVSYGEPVVSALAHFMRDPNEDIWVRRHIPGTLGLITSQASVDVLVAALEEADGFLRYKVIAALDRLRRTDAPLTFPHEPIEALTLREGAQFFKYLSLHDNLFHAKQLAPDSLLADALTQKLERSRDRIYRLLALMYPWRDIAAAEWTMRHGEPRTRASASEYLDNILSGPLRKRIMPIIEDLPHEEKVRRGNVLLKTRPRDLEETLLQLINDEDQVVAATAIELIREQKLWALGDDVEHVLAFRDPHDWYVFESASWALAERRMPASRRRELWVDPLPASEIAGRIRTLALFASVSVDELFRIANASKQVRHDLGTVLLQEGVVPGTVHVLLDGRVAVTGRDASRTIEAPATLGFVEALQGAQMRRTVRTIEVAVTLAMSSEEWRTLLGDNTGLVRGLFTTLADRVSPDVASNLQSTGAAYELQQLAANGLQPVEKILALQRVPVFSRISVDEMRALADITHTEHTVAGNVLFPESAPVALWVILSGEAALSDPVEGGQVLARGGDIVGSLCMLSGRPLNYAAAVLKSGIVLRIDREDLFDLLEQRPDLLRQLFEGIFRMGSDAERAPART
jgi:CRP-like cAMP-binding protein